MTSKKKIIEIAHERRDFYQEVDGYYYWEPKGMGALDARTLRILADELDRLNRDWDRQVKAELAQLALVEKGLL